MNDKNVQQDQNDGTAFPSQKPQSPPFIEQEPSSQADRSQLPVAPLTPTVPRQKWRYFFANIFISVAVFQVLGIGAYLLLTVSLASATGDDRTSIGFMGLFVAFTIVPGAIVGAIVNIVGLPFYLFKYRPKGIGLYLSLFSLLLSIPIAIFGVRAFYPLYT